MYSVYLITPRGAKFLMIKQLTLRKAQFIQRRLLRIWAHKPQHVIAIGKTKETMKDKLIRAVKGTSLQQKLDVALWQAAAKTIKPIKK